MFQAHKHTHIHTQGFFFMGVIFITLGACFDTLTKDYVFLLLLLYGRSRHGISAILSANSILSYAISTLSPTPTAALCSNNITIAIIIIVVVSSA